jgi:hypothetical protein
VKNWLKKARARIQRNRRKLWLDDPQNFHAFKLGYIECAKDAGWWYPADGAMMREKVDAAYKRLEDH